MNIHHVAPHFLPEVGGVETSVAIFASWLVKRGHRVVVHTSSRTVLGQHLAPQAEIDGIFVRRYPPLNEGGYFRTRFLPDLTGAEIVHLHGYAVRTNDIVARRTRGVPLVYSLHHGVRMPHLSRRTRLQRSLYDTFWGLPTLRRIDRIVVAAPGDVAWLRARGIDDSRIRLLQTPLPDQAFLPGDSRWATDRVGTDRFVLYLGRLHQEKGVELLLETLPQLPPDVRIAYAGPDAGALTRLKQRAAQLQRSNDVVFLGAVSESEKRSLLAGCACLVLPSLYEAQGLAVLEAWAQGRPVVATRVGALVDLVRETDTGLLVPYGDISALAAMVRRLLSSPVEAARMGRLGRQRAEAFRLGVVAPQLEALYEEVRPR